LVLWYTRLFRLTGQILVWPVYILCFRSSHISSGQFLWHPYEMRSGYRSHIAATHFLTNNYRSINPPNSIVWINRSFCQTTQKDNNTDSTLYIAKLIELSMRVCACGSMATYHIYKITTLTPHLTFINNGPKEAYIWNSSTPQILTSVLFWVRITK